MTSHPYSSEPEEFNSTTTLKPGGHPQQLQLTPTRQVARAKVKIAKRQTALPLRKSKDQGDMDAKGLRPVLLKPGVPAEIFDVAKELCKLVREDLSCPKMLGGWFVKEQRV